MVSRFFLLDWIKRLARRYISVIIRNNRGDSMTLQQLRYVVAIADNKSMNKAVAELFVTQPSLSNTRSSYL